MRHPPPAWLTSQMSSLQMWPQAAGTPSPSLPMEVRPTMRFKSTAKALAECKFQYYKFSGCALSLPSITLACCPRLAGPSWQCLAAAAGGGPDGLQALTLSLHLAGSSWQYPPPPPPLALITNEGGPCHFRAITLACCSRLAMHFQCLGMLLHGQ